MNEINARRSALAILVALLLASTASSAQSTRPPKNDNAALVYWMAFAEMKDLPADTTTSALLAKTLAGEAPWDEAKLGPILDQNEVAVRTMHRGTKLSECNWGLEYELGPATPEMHLGRALVLARLNTLYGIRLATKGDVSDAVQTWLAGVRFSQDLAQGGTLISLLTAAPTLGYSLSALTRAAQRGPLDGPTKKRIASAIRGLPETGFDWSKAWVLESFAIEAAVNQLGHLNPKEYYQTLMGEPMLGNFSLPKPPDVAAYRNLMARAQEALRMPPDIARERLAKIEGDEKMLHPFFQTLIPHLTGLNGWRAKVQAERQRLLQAVSG